MGLLKDIWQWLSFEEHRQPLELIAEILVTVIAACWVVNYLFRRHTSQKQESAGPGRSSVPDGRTALPDFPQSDQFDVFLIYNSTDREAVGAIAGALEKFGIKPFLDEERLVPGRGWIGDREVALRSSSAVAIFIGASSFGPVQWAEKDLALIMHFRQRKPVIPVLLPNAREEDLPPFLQTLGWVDFRGGIEDPDKFENLVAGIRQSSTEGFRSVVQKRGNPYSHVPPGADLDKLKTSIWDASVALLRWPQTLAGNKWFDRAELERIRKKVRTANRSTTLLLGDSGSGKSALLARLGDELVASGVAVLAIKADMLDSAVSDQDHLTLEIGLPAPIQECLSALSWREPVVLLIDQLDALADLADLRSKRLLLLLDLVCRLADRANVHIVAACRTFEHRHDPRLRGIEAEVEHLALPPWEKVAEVLQEMGFSGATWPPDSQDVLRVPRNLQIFQEVAEAGGEAPPFSSYHAMLEALWSQKVVTPGEGRAALVDEMAKEMAEREDLWLPLAAFQDRASIIEVLEREGILVRDKLRVGFRHRSLFEFAHARTFASREGSLVESVLRGQNALFMRPHLWQALHYLRMADRGTYRQDVGALWANQELRLHVRLLLIEFVGQLPDPEDFEASWIMRFFGSRQDRVRVLRAVAGSPGWFTRLHRGGHLDAMMAEPPEMAIDALFVLRPALKFARGAVLELLDRNWLPHPEKDYLSLRVFDDSGEVDESWVERICSVLRRTEWPGYMVDRLVQQISNDNPDLAPRVVRAYLDRRMEAARRVGIPGLPPLQDDATDEERLQRCMETDPHKPFVDMLASAADLHHVPEVAGRAPRIFLVKLWAWLEKLLVEMAVEENTYRIEYRDDRSADTALSEEQGGPMLNPLIIGFEKAITAFAERNTPAFLTFAWVRSRTDILFLHRLMARGMEKLVVSHPGEVLDFLRADPRRLVLGSSSDSHMESRRLIRALVPFLSEAGLVQLEDYIRQCRLYKDAPGQSAEDRMNRRRWEREDRLRLMRAFPKEHMRPEFRRFVEEEERAFPNLKDCDLPLEFPREGSPITADRMVYARDAHVLGAAREFGELARKEPDRVAALVLKLAPGENELPAGHAVEGLSQSAYPKDRLYGLIEELAGMGFNSSIFRHYAASAVEKAVDREHPLPDTLFTIMESWMEETASKDDAADKEEETKIESVIWGPSRIQVHPSGNYPVLRTLSRACLLLDPPNVERWLEVLEAHLVRREDPAVWRALCAELRWLHLADRERAQTFLDVLFARFPTVLGSMAGATLLARVQNWADEDYLEIWLSALRDGPWANGAAAYGELLLLRCAFHSESSWLQAKLEELRRIGSTDSRIRAMRRGIAYSAAHLWGEQRARALATDILVECMADDAETVRDAASEVFRVMKILPRDSMTDRLLDAVAANPSVLSGTNAGVLIERLEMRASEDPDRVYKICIALLDAAGRKFGDMSTGLYARGRYLVNIALTLQRMGGEHRDRGLQIFERLMELDIHTAKEVLEELDRRPLPRNR